MYAVINPSGISVRRGAVQLRIDFCDDKDDIIHSHFIQISPDATDEEILKLMERCLSDYQNNRPIRQTNYKPFDVNASVEEMVFASIREDKIPTLIGKKMAEHLNRSAIRGWDIAIREKNLMVSR